MVRTYTAQRFRAGKDAIFLEKKIRLSRYAALKVQEGEPSRPDTARQARQDNQRELTGYDSS